MAILGYNVKGATAGALGTGTKQASKWNLAAPATLTELHGWFDGSATNVILFIYSDSAGVPATRLAYTSPLALTGSPVELSQTGFSVALAAGDYWLGWVSQGLGTSGAGFRENTGGTSYGLVSGATFNPPAATFEAGSANTRRMSAWAVVGAAAGPAFVPQVSIIG